MQQNQNRQSQTNSRSVFVGNIPYEATEEQIQEIFAQVGPVVSFRLVFDRETGKPKGYGFVEYRDSQTALSAMRNLNGYEINARALRVYFAEMEKDQNQPSGGGGGGTNMQNDISKVLEGMSNSQLYEIMVQMKGLIQKKPEQAQQLLMNHPHLAYALLNSQVLLGVISPNDAQQLHLAAQQQPGQVNNNNMVNPNAFQMPAFIQQPAYLQPAAIPFMQAGIGMPMQPVNVIQNVATPLGGGGDVFANLDGDKKELLDQILKLTPEQLESFPPQEQAQMIQLRQAMSSYGFRR
jgi:cleavage stimulation factor subunit 2